MEFKTKKISGTVTHDLSFLYTAAELEQGFKKAYEKNKDKVKIPGFRPGKAPLHLIEKALGDSVIDDAVNILLNDSLKTTLEKLDPPPVNVNQFKVDKIEKGKGFTAYTTYESAPDVQLIKLKKAKLEPLVVDIDSESIEKEIKTIQEYLTKSQLKEETETSESGDMVEFQYTSWPQNESPDPKQKPVNGKMRIGAEENPKGFDENLLNRKMGESFEFTYTFPSEFPNMPEIANQSFQYSVNVTAIFKMIPPEINDDLAIDWNGTESLAKLKEDIKKQKEEAINKQLKEFAISKSMDAFTSECKYIFPPSYIEGEVKDIFSNMTRVLRMENVSMEEFAKKIGKSSEEYKKQLEESALIRLKRYFTRRKIAEDEKIILSETEFEEALAKYAFEQQVSVEYMKSMLAKEKSEYILRDRFLMEKVDAHFFQLADKKNEKKISEKEAQAILKGEGEK